LHSAPSGVKSGQLLFTFLNKAQSSKNDTRTS
jgi:hypothetical protein